LVDNGKIQMKQYYIVHKRSTTIVSGNNKYITEPIAKLDLDMSSWLDDNSLISYYKNCIVTIKDKNGKKY